MGFSDLKPRIWVPALLRRAEIQGAFGVIVRKGDPDGGTALIIVRAGDGLCRLYYPVRNIEGERVWWIKGPAQEPEITLYVNQRVDDDPDLWVVEIDDRAGRHFLTDPVEG